MITSIVAAVLGASSFVDGLSTVHFLRKGKIELNPLLGKRPSTLRVFLEGGAIIAAEIGVMFYLSHLSHTAGYVIACALVAQSVSHVVLSIHNFKL